MLEIYFLYINMTVLLRNMMKFGNIFVKDVDIVTKVPKPKLIKSNYWINCLINNPFNNKGIVYKLIYATDFIAPWLLSRNRSYDCL